MKSHILAVLVCGLFTAEANALVINEIMSNPVGDDSGREWVELHNDGAEDIDLSSITVSIKGGNPIAVTPMQGGTTLPAGGYAVIASTVSGQTRFLQDYPAYPGILFRSTISLVNTGSTSIEIKNNGSTAAGPLSYAAAKEGNSLSFVNGEYVAGTPTPGAQNSVPEASPDSTNPPDTTTPTQVTIPQLAPPSPDIVMYLPEEKTVVAGAASEYSAFGLTRSGKAIGDLKYAWAFGDGGQGTGSSTSYTYVYPGRYVAQAEATNASVFGTARMVVRVVSPDMEIIQVGSSRYGTYIDVRNPNSYALDFSQWGFSIDGAFFPFPKNTMLLPNETVRFSGKAMGFASTTVSTSSVVRILFPNLEEVTRYVPKPGIEAVATNMLPEATIGTRAQPSNSKEKKITSKKNNIPQVLGSSTSATKINFSTTSPRTSPNTASRSKDTRIVSWLKNLFRI